MEETRLQAAVRAVKARQYEVARTILSSIVLDEPDNAQAWLWLSFVVKQDDRKLQCLRQVLRIHPENKTALREVERLEEKLKASQLDPHLTEMESDTPKEQEMPPEVEESEPDGIPPSEDYSASVETESDGVEVFSSVELSNESNDKSHLSSIEKEPIEKRSRRGLWTIIILLSASICLALAFFGLLYLPKYIMPVLPGDRLPAGVMMTASQLVISATLTPTGTPTPTATETPTLTPTQTPFPSETITTSSQPIGTAMGGSGSIAFVSDRMFNSEIYLMEIDSGSFLNLSKDLTYDGMPVWSADGKTMMFASERNNPCEGKGKCSQVYLLDLVSDSVRRISDFDSIQVLPQAWLPDGRIALSVNRAKELTEGDQDQEYDLYLVKQNGTEQILWHEEPGWGWLQGLEGNLFPQWSSNGEKVLVSLIAPESGRSDLLLVNSDGSDPQSIVPESLKDGMITEPCWSPDNQYIAFIYSSVEDIDVNQIIYIVNIDGSGLKILAEDGQNSHPSWSPDGNLIAFASDCNGDWEIFIAKVNQGDIQQLTIHAGKDLWPAWRP